MIKYYLIFHFAVALFGEDSDQFPLPALTVSKFGIAECAVGRRNSTASNVVRTSAPITESLSSVTKMWRSWGWIWIIAVSSLKYNNKMSYQNDMVTNDWHSKWIVLHSVVPSYKISNLNHWLCHIYSHRMNLRDAFSADTSSPSRWHLELHILNRYYARVNEH